jgi:hypothetical protein
VDGIDVKNKTFEQVVFLINEAKLRCKLKLLVYPSVVINYGNPQVANLREEEETVLQNQQINSSHYVDTRSMPDLSYDENQTQSYHDTSATNNHNHNNFIIHNYDLSTSRCISKNKISHQSMINDYDTIYIKKPNNLNISKSSSNIYGTTLNSSILYSESSSSHNNDLLRYILIGDLIFKNSYIIVLVC